ncbi:hypothetical protein [Flavobacterium sp. T12S277]|uniref:hypothetical protein n=1 Tax=Flavobacterium sp. T12S277 TaxID=3402752 RepID=UPI003AE5D4D1
MFPQVIINDNGNTYTFGTNNAARGNRVDQKIFQIQNDVTINLGKHKISTGISYQLIDLLNEFTFNPQGTFIFNSLPSFYNSSPIGTITPLGVSSGSGLPTAYSLGYTLQPGRTVTLDKAKFVQFGVYMQDEFFPTEKLKITAGVRADVTAFLTNPQNNPAVPGYNFQNAIGELEKYNTTNTPRTTVLISPRVGFNWDIKGDRTLQLRGGSGIFSGNIPFVYIKTGFINGLNEGAINAPTAAQAAAYPFNPDPRAYIPTDGKMAANYELNFIAPNFKLPQTFRSTLGLDAKLPGNIIASIEAVYSSDINAPYYRNANLNYNTSTTSPDGRLKYTSARINPNITGAYVLDNISKGSQFFLTESISKQFSKDFAVSLSYTYGESKDVYPLRSTIASGAFNAIQVVGNPNVPVKNYSDYDLRHRIVGSLNYRISYAKDKMASSIGIFFEGAQQGRGTYAYGGTGNVNQDGSNANDLIFVPQNQSQINLVASSTATVEQQWDALDRFISNSKYLKNRRGQFAERNGILLPWYYQADIKFSQDFSGLLLKNKNTLQVTVDIINFTNLINKNWGVYNTIANTTPITALSATTFQVNPVLLQRGEFIQDNGLNSRYRIQVGVRYSFN